LDELEEAKTQQSFSAALQQLLATTADYVTLPFAAREVLNKVKRQIMSVYRLDPINLTDPSWELSSVKEAVWAAAATDSAARELVSHKTIHSMRKLPDFQPIPNSPWLNDKVTSCVLYPGKKDIQEGNVMTLQGRSLPLTSF